MIKKNNNIKIENTKIYVFALTKKFAFAQTLLLDDEKTLNTFKAEAKNQFNQTHLTLTCLLT
jgi:hypothetical protein